MKKNFITGVCFVVVFGCLFGFSNSNKLPNPIAAEAPKFDWAKIENTPLIKSFDITKTEVTQLQWFTVMGENPSHFAKKEYCPESFDEENNLCPNHPVESVSWNRVQEFISKLNTHHNKTGCDEIPKNSSGCYRLPTDIEWIVAKGEEEVEDLKLEDYAWIHINSNNQTHAVGQKQANINGLFDMYGNVWEWGQGPLLYFGETRRPILGNSQYGSISPWTYRTPFGPARPDYHSSGLGFRLVRTQ